MVNLSDIGVSLHQWWLLLSHHVVFEKNECPKTKFKDLQSVNCLTDSEHQPSVWWHQHTSALPTSLVSRSANMTRIFSYTLSPSDKHNVTTTQHHRQGGSGPRLKGSRGPWFWPSGENHSINKSHGLGFVSGCSYLLLDFNLRSTLWPVGVQAYYNKWQLITSDNCFLIDIRTGY